MNSDSAFAGVAILMLTSAGQPGDAASCRTLGISAYLVKPTSEVDLRDALLAAVGLPSMKGEVVLPITRHVIAIRKASCAFCWPKITSSIR